MDERRHRAFPVIRYSDAATGITWLENALGAVAFLVVPGADDTIEHAELKLGGSVFFVGSFHPMAPVDRPEQSPGNASMYVLVDDVDEAYREALAHGATGVRAPEDSPTSGRGCTLRDPEGNIWGLGDYRPSSF